MISISQWLYCWVANPLGPGLLITLVAPLRPPVVVLTLKAPMLLEFEFDT